MHQKYSRKLQDDNLLITIKPSNRGVSWGKLALEAIRKGHNEGLRICAVLNYLGEVPKRIFQSVISERRVTRAKNAIQRPRGWTAVARRTCLALG